MNIYEILDEAARDVERLGAAPEQPQPQKPNITDPREAAAEIERANDYRRAEQLGQGKVPKDTPTADKVQKASTANQEKGLLRRLQGGVRDFIPDGGTYRQVMDKKLAAGKSVGELIERPVGGLRGGLRTATRVGGPLAIPGVTEAFASTGERLGQEWLAPSDGESWDQTAARWIDAPRKALFQGNRDAGRAILDMFGIGHSPYEATNVQKMDAFFSPREQKANTDDANTQPKRPDWNMFDVPEDGKPITFSDGTVRPAPLQAQNGEVGVQFDPGQFASMQYADDPDGSKTAAFQQRVKDSIAAGAYDRRQPKLTDQQNQLLQLSQYLGVDPNALAGAATYKDALDALGGYRKNIDGGAGGARGGQKQAASYFESVFPDKPKLARSLAVQAQAQPEFAEADDPYAMALLDYIARTTNNTLGGDSVKNSGAMSNLVEQDWWSNLLPWNEEYSYNRGGNGVFGLDTDVFGDYPEPVQMDLWNALRSLQKKPEATGSQ